MTLKSYTWLFFRWYWPTIPCRPPEVAWAKISSSIIKWRTFSNATDHLSLLHLDSGTTFLSQQGKIYVNSSKINPKTHLFKEHIWLILSWCYSCESISAISETVILISSVLYMNDLFFIYVLFYVFCFIFTVPLLHLLLLYIDT